ncbi:hypothetical protein [Rhodoligotrophos ferricapiens]|uniref:hypothetical protein n=1 Tax=Rhodoligotrophos ferricapiens TaxID=3069264 RepID=UPI00315D2E3E
MAWAWYRAGTVSVTANSDAVTGAGGTQWAAGNVKAGDAFIGPDGKIYEIEAVASDTSIKLRTDYQGTTASGQQYAMAPFAPMTQAVYSKLVELLNQLAGELNVGSVKIGGAATEVALAVLGDVSLEADDSGNQITTLSRNSVSRAALLMLATAMAPRARVGLVNDDTDNLHIEVSTDGSTWTPALSLRNADGVIVVHQGIEDELGNPIGGGGDQPIAPGDIEGAATNTTSILGKLAADGTKAMRELDLAALQQALGTIVGRNLTISTSDPSGGADGDLWFKVT